MSFSRPRCGLVVLAGLLATLTIGGCGSDGSSPSSASGDRATGEVAPADAALRFTQCMRRHGIALADPAPGANTVQLPASAKTDPRTQEALGACRHFLSQGVNKDAGDPAAQDNALQLARCLREHGLDADDPQPGQPLRLNVNTRDPATMQAIQECRSAGSRNGNG